jgi:hypothetical protein
MSVQRILGRASALRVVGAALRGDPPPLDERGWSALVELAGEHDLQPALWAAVVRYGVSSRQPSPTHIAELELAYRSNLGRSIRIRRQLLDALTAMNMAGVEPVAIKGSMYLLTNTFRDAGERVMADLDLLVDRPDLDRAVDALTGFGYRVPPRPVYEAPHEVRLFAPGTPVPLEVHNALGAASITTVLPTEEVLESALRVEREGVRYRIPTPTHAVLHQILHAQVQDRNHLTFGIPLRQLHTFGRLVRTNDGRVDWSWLRRRMSAHGFAVALDAYIDLAHHFGGADSLPPVEGPTARLLARRVTVLVSASLGWPSDVVRNLQDALGPGYLRHRYGPSGSLTAMRARHLVATWRERGRSTIAEATRPWR